MKITITSNSADISEYLEELKELEKYKIIEDRTETEHLDFTLDLDPKYLYELSEDMGYDLVLRCGYGTKDRWVFFVADGTENE